MELWGGSEVMMVERKHEERRRLMSEAFQRGAARLARERERQRTAEVEKSLRLRELHLANEAAEAQAHPKVGPLVSANTKEKPHR